MSRTMLRSPLGRWVTLPVTVSALAIAWPAQAITLFPVNETLPETIDYQRCARQLLDVGLSNTDTATACAEALQPQDLSLCVARIANTTDLAATDALSGCTRVRRPVELATCVTEIKVQDEAIASSEVLDYCRRSLLPDRFSDCVVGLSQEIDFSTALAMDSCIAVNDRPETVLPSFIPAGASNPTPANPLFAPSTVTPAPVITPPVTTPNSTVTPTPAPASRDIRGLY